MSGQNSANANARPGRPDRNASANSNAPTYSIFRSISNGNTSTQPGPNVERGRGNPFLNSNTLGTPALESSYVHLKTAGLIEAVNPTTNLFRPILFAELNMPPSPPPLSSHARSRGLPQNGNANPVDVILIERTEIRHRGQFPTPSTSVSNQPPPRFISSPNSNAIHNPRTSRPDASQHRHRRDNNPDSTHGQHDSTTVAYPIVQNTTRHPVPHNQSTTSGTPLPLPPSGTVHPSQHRSHHYRSSSSGNQYNQNNQIASQNNGHRRNSRNADEEMARGSTRRSTAEYLDIVSPAELAVEEQILLILAEDAVRRPLLGRQPHHHRPGERTTAPRPATSIADGEPPAPRATEEMTVNLECKACMNQPIDTVFLPCGHAVLCRWCARRHMQTNGSDRARSKPVCPMCRAPVRQRVGTCPNSRKWKDM